MVSIVFLLLIIRISIFVLGIICVHDLNFPTRRWNIADDFELMQSTMI